jgi:hypothetical protein
MKFSEIIRYVVAMATAIQESRAEVQKGNPTYSVISEFKDFGPPLPQQDELRDFLKGLPTAKVYMLAVIMYLGRGDFGIEKLLERYEEVSDRFHKPEWAIDQMLGKAPLAKYMFKGQTLLENAGIDVDGLLDR